MAFTPIQPPEHHGQCFNRDKVMTTKTFTLVLGLILSASLCQATTYYVSQNGGTFSGGSACNGQSTHPYSWLSSSGNYTAGDTIYLCGSFSSELQMANSGTSASSINVIFDTGANITRAFCDSNGCFNFGGNSYIVLDGGTNTPCGWDTQVNSSEGTCNGYIQATANGSNLANQQSGTGIVGGGGSNLEIRNIGVYNTFVHVAGGSVCPSGCGSLNFSGNSISIHDSTFHDGDWLLTYTWSTSSGWTVYDNQIYNMDHGIALAGATTDGSLTGVDIHGNYIHDYSLWDTSGCSYHHDGIHIYSQGGSTVSANIYNNIFGGAMGSCGTAQIFQESTTVAGTENIYNNVLYYSDNPSGGTGIVALGPNSGTISLYDNTITCNSANGGPAGVLLNVATFSFKNNLVRNCSPLLWLEGGTTASDHNAFDTATCSGGGNGCFKWQGGGGIATLSTWQSTSAGDANSQGGATNLSAAYKPLSGSSAIGAGANLTDLDMSTLDSDLSGLLRAASGSCTPGTAGCWDAGSYLFSSGNSQPAPPSSLTAVVQ